MKSILVSGGTRGLGLAICHRLARDGHQVIAMGRQQTEPLRELMESDDFEGRVVFEPLDLSNSESIHGIVRGISQRFGTIHGLINNAAVGHDGVLTTMHDSQIEELIQVNLLGSILLTKYVSRSMLVHREGRIVNIASIIGHTGFSGLSVYAATKAAMLGFTRSLARELGKAGIMVNSVSPGYMQTDMTRALDENKLEKIQRRSPLSRLVTIDEVAGTVSFLMGEDAKSMTGTDIVIDAGSRA